MSPFRRVGMGMKVLLVGLGVGRTSPRAGGVKRPSKRAGRGWEAQPNGREGSEGPVKGLGVVDMPSQRVTGP